MEIEAAYKYIQLRCRIQLLARMEEQQEDMKAQAAHLIKMIKECNGTQDNVKVISRYCLSKSGKAEMSEVEIAKIFENCIAETFMTDMKLNVLRIMTEILIENTTKTYIRHLSTRILMLIDTCKHVFTNETDSATIAIIKAVFAKWKETKVFTDAFYNRILATAGPDLIFKLQNDIQPFQFKRYSKKFLMEVRDANRNEMTAIFYKQFRKLEKYNEEIGKISSREISLSIEPNSQIINQTASKLLEETDKLIEDHILTLTTFYSGIELASKFYKEEEQLLGISVSSSKDQDD